MWRLGFFFHEMGFGLLSIFLPLYVIAIGGSLAEIGIMAASALFMAIPASFLWGYVCDKTKHYKRYVLLSFLTSTIILYLFTLTTNLGLLIIMYAVMSFLHIAHEPPKNVLIAELYSHKDWKRSFAFYEGFTEAGWLIGLVLGFLTSAYPAVFSFQILDVKTLPLLLCSVLNLIAFCLSLILVTDPLFVFERGLVNLEKSVDFACHGVFLASRLLGGEIVSEKLRKENLGAFCFGLALFSLATSILFTPMPIFVSNIVRAAALPSSIVFAIFVLNSGGGVLGYLLAGARSEGRAGKAAIGRVVIFRSFLSFLLVVVLQFPAFNVMFVTTILILMGFGYAIFLVYVLSLSMELIPSGKTGLFNALIGVGGACGSFIGPFLAQTFGSLGFTYVFVTAGTLFLVSYVAFRVLM